MEESEEVPAHGKASSRREKIAEKPDKVSAPTPKSGPPGLDEWQDFFSRFVVKILVDLYLSLMLGDFIDELTPAELQRITLTKDDFRQIASPLAEITNQSSYMRKHGRSIIALAESSESLLTLLFWMRAVNKVAKKHRRPEAKPKTMRAQRVSAPTQENQNAAQSHGFDNSQVNGTQYPAVGVFNPGSG